MNANFNKPLLGYSGQSPFKFWCQTVMPLVFDDSLSYYETLCKLKNYLNNVISDMSTVETNVENLHETYTLLENYVNTYFDNLDVQAEINDKLDEMANNGELSTLIEPYVSSMANPLIAQNVAGMTNKNRLYVNKSDGYLYYWNGTAWQSTGLIYGNVDTETTYRFIGKCENLGLTNFSDCTNIGYYSFNLQFANNAIDKPADLKNGGYIWVTPYIYTTFVEQRITDINGKTWRRIQKPELLETTKFKTVGANKGEYSKQNVTSLGAITTTGFYQYTSLDFENMSDLPNGVTRGGNLYVVEPFASGYVNQFLTTVENQIFFRNGSKTNLTEQPWVTLHDSKKSGAESDTIAYFFGDSITEGYYSKPDGHSAIDKNNSIPMWIKKFNGYTVYNYAVGGSGYLARRTQTNPDVDNAKMVIGRTDFTNCDLVYMSFGINDYHYGWKTGTPADSPELGNTMCSNMKWCIEHILTENPNIKIVVATPIIATAYGGDIDSYWCMDRTYGNSETLRTVIVYQKQICEYYGIQCIEQTTNSPVNRFNAQSVLLDGVHPSYSITKQMAKSIAKQIAFA